MNLSLKSLLVCLALSGWAVSDSAMVRAEEPAVYVFDLLARQPYRANLAKLLGTSAAPDWVKDIVKAGAGTAGPGKSINLAGKIYRLDHVCKVHDCAGHALTIVWAPGGRQVWAALSDGNGPPVLFGSPTPELSAVLTKAAQ